MKFVTRLDGGEGMTDLCLEFGISRKTGHKIWNRYKEFGAKGLFDRSRRPHYLARQTREDIQEIILTIKGQHLKWGATKIRDNFERNYPKFKAPARATVHAILDKHGFVKRRKKRVRKIYPGFNGLTSGVSPNSVWSTDYKGQFKMANLQYCYPLTVADHFSRYMIGCEALANTRADQAEVVFTELFREYGLPSVIRSDNGVPFASQGLLGLSRLSVWWLKLGIQVERTEPGKPQQNGRHERMHLTLKQETMIAKNLLQQQEYFEEFREQYNHQRPHEGIGLKRPAELYYPSPRKMPRYLEPLEYPDHELTRLVDTTGRITVPQTSERVFLSTVLAGENVGLDMDGEDLWRVTFKELDLGFVDTKTNTFSPSEKGLK